MNAKRPTPPKARSYGQNPAGEITQGAQSEVMPHDNMAPFLPAPIKNVADVGEGGSYVMATGADYLTEDEKGTGSA